MKNVTQILWFICLMLMQNHLQAQTCTSLSGATLIEGYVKDSAGRNIEGVRIMADGGIHGGLPHTSFAITNASGFYQIPVYISPTFPGPTSYSISADMTDAHNAYYFSAINLTSGTSNVMCGMPVTTTPTADFTVVWKPRSFSGKIVPDLTSSPSGFSGTNMSHPNLSLVNRTIELQCQVNSTSTTLSSTTTGTGGTFLFNNIQNTNPCINGFYKLNAALPNYMQQPLFISTSSGSITGLHGYNPQTVASSLPFSITDAEGTITLKTYGFIGEYKNSVRPIVVPNVTINFAGSKDGPKSVTTNGSYYGTNANGFPGGVVLVGCDPITATPSKMGFTFTPTSITQNFSTCATTTSNVLFSSSNNFLLKSANPYTVIGKVVFNNSRLPVNPIIVKVTVGTFIGYGQTDINGNYAVPNITEVGPIELNIAGTIPGYQSFADDPLGLSQDYDGSSTTVTNDIVILTSPTCTALNLPTQAYAPGNISVPITVADFSNIGAISAKINYNATQLTFTGLSGEPSGMQTSAANGVLTLAWSNISPLSLANGATLATLNFTYTGNATPTPLTFQVAPNTELANGSGAVTCHTPTNGSISQLSYKINGKVFAQTYSGTTVTKNIGNVSLNLTGTATASTTSNTTTYATSPNQNYTFAGLNNGNYTVAVAKTGEWCGASNPITGVNATDAQWITDNFLGTRTFNALQTASADVNNSGSINMTDAFQTQLRVAGTLTSFAKGDWTFNPSSAAKTIANADVSQDFETMVVGDVDGSCADVASNAYKTKSQLIATKSDQVKVDFGLNEAANLRAATLFIHLPQGITVAKVEAPLLKDFVYGMENNTLKFVWTDTTIAHLNTQMPMLSVWFNNPSATPFNLETESVFSNPTGEKLNQITPEIKNIATPIEAEIPTENALHGAYPNPFSANTQISFSLTEAQNVSLKVYNMLGQELATLAHETHFEAGKHQLSFEGIDLPNGIYLVRLATPSFQQNQQITKIK